MFVLPDVVVGKGEMEALGWKRRWMITHIKLHTESKMRSTRHLEGTSIEQAVRTSIKFSKTTR